ncbi:MAG: glycosyltransferase [Acidimicrobiales bacterium]
MNVPSPAFAHLRRLTDHKGVFEHAQGIHARREGGYCVDDAARALVVVSREPMAEANPGEQPGTPSLEEMAGVYLGLLLAAQVGDGRFRNRLGFDGSWEDQPGVEDCWGRALWGLGALISSPLLPASRQAALAAFTLGSSQRSRWPRSMAFAALGAAEVLHDLPDHLGARALIAAAAEVIGKPSPSRSWRWPEERLAYANAVLPDALVAAGVALGDEQLLADGLLLLEWLLDQETLDGHLSLTPVGGRAPSDRAPGFDQQPIEAAALADACARAYSATGEARWLWGVELAVGWFLGSNDSGTCLYDPESGGGCDGLERFGRNENQGAESTLALLSTLQQGRQIPVATEPAGTRAALGTREVVGTRR